MRKLLLVMLLAVPVFAGDLSKLTIKVTSDTGKPVERASVIVKFIEGRSIVKLGKSIRKSWEMRTTQEGIANLPDVPKGKILIQVIAKNYQTFGNTYDVDEDERTLEIKLNPPQQQYSSH